MPQLLDRVLQYIQAQHLPLPGQPVLVALSGGADSVALLLVLKELGYEVAAVHCNFGLRDDAVHDEAFVVDLANSLAVPLKVYHFGPKDFARYPGEGIQQAARKLRYAAFETLMTESGIDHCATGHHADDQTETLLLSFFRGNGPHLLQGIPPQRGSYFRPLLATPKQDLIDWLQSRGQAWRHDASNDTDKYQRNIVRNHLIPTLEQLHPRFQDRFEAQAMRHQAQWNLMAAVFEPLRSTVVSAASGQFTLSMAAFEEYLDAAHFPVFLDWWLSDQGFGGTEINEIQRLVNAHIGATYKGVAWEVLKDRECLRFQRRKEDFAPLENPQGSMQPIELPEFDSGSTSVEWAGYAIHLERVPKPTQFEHLAGAETHWMDWSAIRFPLKLRPWKLGDRMQPMGMAGTKKLSDVFIDQKRDQFSKNRSWVLEDAIGIVLVSGYRIAGRVAVTADTEECLRVTVQPSV